MKKKLLLLFYFLSLNSQAAINEIVIDKKKTPYLLVLMVEHLQKYSLNTEQEEQLLLNMIEINNNLQYVDRVNRTFFVTSEAYKTILNYKFDYKRISNGLTTDQYRDATKLIKQTSQNYSDFTLFIVQSTLSDFKSFTKDGLLERYNKKTIYSNKDIKQLTALKKRLKYSAPWITLFLNDDKKKYAHKLNNLIIEFMHNLAIQSKLFSLHNKLGKNKDFPVIFSNIKLLSTTKTTQPEVKESEKSPKDIIKDLDTIPRPNPSKEIDQLMNKI